MGARNSPQEAFRQTARHSGEQCSIGFQPVFCLHRGGASIGGWFLSRRDRAIVARHEVPGTSPPKRPSRRVRYDSCRCAHFDSVIEVIGVTKFRPRKQKKFVCHEMVHHIEHHRAFRAATIGVVLRDALSTRKTSGISCARSYRTLRDGSFGARFQALRARLRSVVPTGRKYILRTEPIIILALMGFKPS